MLHPERRQQLAQGQTAASLLHQFVEIQAICSPQAIALQIEQTSLSYAFLNARANQLAHWLLRSGLSPDERVGLCLPRSCDLILCLLAILKAGAAFVPLDPDMPENRLRFLAHDARLSLLFTHQALLARLPALATANLALDTLWEQICGLPVDNPNIPVQPEQMAYVIYTSGSTGQLKGVCCHHRGAMNLLEECERLQPLRTGDRCSLWTSVSFDVSVYEIFSAFQGGATLCPVPDSLFSQGTRVLPWLAEQQITSAYLPAFLLGDFQQMAENKMSVLALRRLLVGVEPIQEDLLARINQQVEGLLIINGYGPTETSICATLYTVQAGQAHKRRTPIGFPLPHTTLSLLDTHQQPVPPGMPGEIYIGGAGLARGYLGQPALTAARFLPHPFSHEQGARIYKTGDLARQLPEGALEFLGRSDHQIKLRGQRIEPGEIEDVLQRHPAIAEAVVVLRTDPPEEPRLVAYLVGKQEPLPADSQLYQHLQTRLPAGMLPACFLWLQSLPMTSNGKLDRQKLPAPTTAGEQAQKTSLAAGTPLEGLIMTIWSQVLGRRSIGPHENFFAQGGHSLLATRVLARIQRALGIDLTLRTLFAHPTLAQFTRQVAAMVREEAAFPPLLPAPRDASPPCPSPLLSNGSGFWPNWPPTVPFTIFQLPGIYRATWTQAAWSRACIC